MRYLEAIDDKDLKLRRKRDALNIGSHTYRQDAGCEERRQEKIMKWKRRLLRMENQHLRKEDRQKGGEKVVGMEGKGSRDFGKIQEL